MRKAFVAGLVAALSLGWASAASAATYTIEYRGFVTSTEADYGGGPWGPTTGAPVYLRFWYDLQSGHKEVTSDSVRYFSTFADVPNNMLLSFNIQFNGIGGWGAAGSQFSELRQNLLTGEIGATGNAWLVSGDPWVVTSTFNPLTPVTNLEAEQSTLGTGTGTFNLPYTGPQLKGTFSLVSMTIIAPGVAGIPEPTTWAMMITGFGLAGAALRRRRTVAAAA